MKIALTQTRPPRHITHLFFPVALATANAPRNNGSYMLYAVQQQFRNNSGGILTQIYQGLMLTSSNNTSWQLLKLRNAVVINTKFSQVMIATVNYSIVLVGASALGASPVQTGNTNRSAPHSRVHVWELSLTERTWKIVGIKTASGTVSQIAFIPSINTFLLYRHFGQARLFGVIDSCSVFRRHYNCKLLTHLPFVKSNQIGLRFPNSYTLTASTGQVSI